MIYVALPVCISLWGCPAGPGLECNDEALARTATSAPPGQSQSRKTVKWKLSAGSSYCPTEDLPSHLEEESHHVGLAVDDGDELGLGDALVDRLGPNTEGGGGDGEQALLLDVNSRTGWQRLEDKQEENTLRIHW